MAASLDDLHRELVELTPLAGDLTPANLALLQERLPPLTAALGEHLVARREGVARMAALGANRLLPDALYRDGVRALRAKDHGRAEHLLLQATAEQVAAALRLIDWRDAMERPALDNEIAEAVSQGWQSCWELTKAQRGNGRWEAAEQALAAVAERVATDGRWEGVQQDLKAVRAKLTQVRLRDGGHRLRAALHSLRRDVRQAEQPAPTITGYIAATGEAPGRVHTPFFTHRNYERRTRGR
ncbi:hypothetical protein LG943_07215 [Streptomonospora sp. S1-112]|uniref:Uncharacterized protein n=1 Tax=Streptomonospora mangrovi TaxID=2883123 RepID=A0A9X3SM83_9ACTN|nr:hypothetical protein [Streptomonospora mangrovi]MDA0564116.1 hypothetical protein [Streptomonospora mangrovi]